MEGGGSKSRFPVTYFIDGPFPDFKMGLFFGNLPPAPGGYEGEHHTPSVIWFRACSSTNLCMAFVSTDEIGTPSLVVRSQSSVDGATPQLAIFKGKIPQK